MHDSTLHETDCLPCPGCGHGSYHPEAVEHGGVGSWCSNCESYVDVLARKQSTPDTDAPSAADPDDPRSEAEIQAAIVEALGLYRVAIYDLSQPQISHQTPGLPDLYVVGYGTHLWAEIKRPKGRLSQAQEFFRETCRANGIPHAVWRSERDAVEWVERVRAEEEAA